MTAEAPERYPVSPLKVLQDRSPDQDEDLLFLFLAEDQVFLKLTRTCNNICSFCCDTVFWNGTHMETERVAAKIQEGARKGLKRLFLSGGEPTIHPDFIKLVRYGKQLGYEQIVTITNGRMFYYEEFATKSVRAGLTEVIFSLNSHDAKTHDALVGVKGAYDQVIAGITNVRRLGCPFRMNVVVTAKNHHQLPDMVSAFHALGALSATFLQLVPNDRDWERSRGVIYYETELARPYVRAALTRASELGFGIELKKFPDNFFEGHEAQIPEPVSWALELGEIDWRRPDRHAPYKQGGPVKCWGERCSYCAYRPFCTHLMHHQAVRREARFDGFELEADAETRPSTRTALERQPHTPLRVLGSSAGAVAPTLASHPDRPRSVRLQSLENVEALPPDVTLIVSSADQLERARDLENHLDIELNRSTVDWLKRNVEWVRSRGDRLTLSPQLFLRLESALREQVDLREVFTSVPLERARLVNVPACLSGRREPSRAAYFATQELLAEVEDVVAHARHYHWQRYMTKSERCRGCAMNTSCDGVHINYVRQFGYRTLEPIVE